jgi:hypothetical protein
MKRIKNIKADLHTFDKNGDWIVSPIELDVNFCFAMKPQVVEIPLPDENGVYKSVIINFSEYKKLGKLKFK